MNLAMEDRMDDFFNYATERYRIYLRRLSDEPKPWTQDHILQQFRFCNVFREDDKVTAWFRRQHRRGPNVSVFSCVAFRYFNRISTGEELIKAGLLTNWSAARATEALGGLTPLVGAAYIIKTPTGKNKLQGIIEILEPIWWDHKAGRLDLRGYTLEQAHARLIQYPYVGSFMAYEAVSDLQHTPILGKAPDIMTWAAAGPGAARGLARLMGVPLTEFSHHKAKDRDAMVKLMQEILVLSRQKVHWSANWPKWDMRTPEMTLCEFDKYERVRLGEGLPKQRYDGL